jgi:hypothetical protein
MASETIKREEYVDPQAIARWDNEGGAPGPLKRVARRLQLHDAVEFKVPSTSFPRFESYR